MDEIDWNSLPCWVPFFAFSRLNFTSSDVSGDPSENLTPDFSLMVQLIWSALGVGMSAAIAGSILSSLLIRYRLSAIRATIWLSEDRTNEPSGLRSTTSSGRATVRSPPWLSPAPAVLWP